MISPERRAALEAYLRLCRDQLRLQAWDIEVSEKPPDEDDAILAVEPDPRRHWGPIRVGSFFDTVPDEQRQTVAHELVHLIQGDLWYYLESGPWRSAWAPDAAHLHEEAIRLQLEIQADAIARIIAPLLPPLPAWPQ